MIYTTLNRIRAKGPCSDGWALLLGNLGKAKADDEPLAFDVILASNGIADALWCLRCVDEPVLCRRLAVAFAREVLHLMKDPHSIAALDVVERFVSGWASADELADAQNAADAAAAEAAYAAAEAAYAGACSAAACSAAACSDAYAAAEAAAAAYYADAAAPEARTKARQSEIFLEMLKEPQP